MVPWKSRTSKWWTWVFNSDFQAKYWRCGLVPLFAYSKMWEGRDKMYKELLSEKEPGFGDLEFSRLIEKKMLKFVDSLCSGEKDKNVAGWLFSKASIGSKYLIYSITQRVLWRD